MENNIIYIIHAAEKDNPDTYALDTYGAANSFELANKIAQKDQADGMIHEGWSIQKMYLSTSEADV